MRKKLSLVLALVFAATLLVGTVPSLAATQTLTVRLSGNRTGWVTYTVDFVKDDFDDVGLSEDGDADTVIDNFDHKYTFKVDKGSNGVVEFTINLNNMNVSENEGRAAVVTFVPDVPAADKISVVNGRQATQIMEQTQNVITILPGTVTALYHVEFNGEGNGTPLGATIKESTSTETYVPKISARPIGDGDGTVNKSDRGIKAEMTDEYLVGDKTKWEFPLTASAKVGSKFVGWYNADGTAYAPASDITVMLTDADVDLYAKFVKTTDDTTGITDPTVPKGSPALPKTGGIPMLMVSSAGIGLLSLGLLFRRKKKPEDMD